MGVYQRAFFKGEVNISKYYWIKVGCIILKDVHIEDNYVIEVACIVINNILLHSVLYVYRIK